MNLESAKKVLAGNASETERQMLQLQLDANQQARHPALMGKTLEQFALWIVDFEKIMLLGAWVIVSTRVKGIALTNSAKSVDEVKQIKATLAQDAERPYQGLI